MSSTRPLRTTRQSSRDSAGATRGAGGRSRDDEDTASASSSGGARGRAAARGGGGKAGAASVSEEDEDAPSITGAGGGGGGAGKKAGIPGFLTKTYEIFSSGEYSDLCGWGAGGDTIIIKKVRRRTRWNTPFGGSGLMVYWH